MAERTGGQLLVDALAHQGVRTIFGIPGVQLDHAADALYQAADRISFFCARNEQATTYMADGYARSTGTPGVAMVVPGPGVLNALAGLATAYSANSRVLAASTGAGTGEYAEPSPVLPSDADVERAARLLLAAKRPLIYVGGGLLAAGASAALTELAEVLEAPVLVSENARGAIDARHRLAFDGLALRAFRTDADLVLGVGTRFMTTFGRQIDVGRAALVLLNADPADLGEPRAAELAIHADAGLGLRALAAAVGRPHRGSREDEFERVRTWLEDCLADITPQRGYLAAIRSVLPDDGVFVSEFTQVGYAASVCFPVYHPRGYIGPGYQGTLGYGFATALGAKAADPSRAVISVTGDGGFSWTMQELSTLRRYGLGLVTIVFNDGYFGNVRRIQKNRYGGRYFASDLTNPDYQQLAGAFGIGFACARDPGSLAGVLRDAVAASEPVLVEVPVGEFPSPWHLIHEGIPRPAPIAPGAHLPAERRHA